MQTLAGTIPGNNPGSSFIHFPGIKKWLFVIAVILTGSFISNKTMAQFSEIPVTGFNADVVADGTTNPDATTVSTAGIDGAGWIFASNSYYPSAVGSPCNTTNGFPASITSTNTTTNTGITYNLQAVNANNALRLLPAETGALSVVTPVNAAKLYIVCLGGDGAAAFSALVTFTDATTETLTSSAPDWCMGAATYKITPTEYYRIKRTSVTCDGALCPYIYEVPLNISQANFAKTISSITFTNNATGAILNVLAIGRRNGFNPGQTYTTNGNASQDDCHTYTLTNPQSTQSGSVWNNIKIDLTNSFTFLFDVYLGTIDATGADGMAFVLQPISTSIGVTGSGLGFGGVSPSIGVTLDTYQNSMPDSDPVYDHIAIQRNGVLDHLSTNNLAGPVQIINGVDNAEDGQWHKLKIVWDATTHTLEAWIDGSLRVTHTEDLVATTFSNDPLVYWGFTGSTGLYYNLQRFRTALEPHWHFGPAQTLCVNDPITFIDSTISFTTIAGVSWDFGDNSPLNTTDLSPTHSYTTAGTYTVTQTVTGADGCEETNTQTVIVGGGITITSLAASANCTSAGSITLTLPATPGPFTTTWNTTPVQNGTTATNLSPGDYTATVIDGDGCTSTHTATVPLFNNMTFVTDNNATICSGSSFTTNTQSNATVFAWTPTTGVSNPTGASPILSPTTTTTYSVHATLQFCDSTRTITITVPVVSVNAGNDQTITAGSSIQLQTSASTGTYLWTPATGLSSSTTLSPLASPTETTTYTLTVTTADGCTNSDVVTIEVKPDVDVNCSEPMVAFTPNGDGINDLWKVGLEGCYVNAAVHVYNRYGTAVFENDNYKNDWEGRYKGKLLPDGTYYFVIDFTYSNKKRKQVRGNVTILR
ncbi:MAG: gliding motility-associated C-terminal domain-containing protein [Ferruginibacter sp.]